jgi:DNA-binding GntR family transcriptional regulator
MTAQRQSGTIALEGDPIRRLSLARQIEDRLRRQILGGELRPGQRLTEQGVAKAMGTSPGPVREAFSVLARDGLVLSLANRGTFVSEVSEATAKLAYRIRSILEPEVAVMAMSSITPGALRELRERIQLIREFAKRNEPSRAFAADMSFHGYLFEMVGGELYSKVWAPIQDTILKFQVVASPQYYPRPYDDEQIDVHDHLVELIESGDQEAVRRAVQEHTGDIWRRIEAASTAGGPRNRSSAD